MIAAPRGDEGFRVQAVDGNVVVAGNDARGMLFGVGSLLRNCAWSAAMFSKSRTRSRSQQRPGCACAAISSATGPRPTPTTAGRVAMWEQYIRDLAVFGTNAIELIPPRSDDAADSPHFPLPPMRNDGRRCRASATTTAWTSGSGIRRWTRTTPTRRPSSPR